MVPIIYDNTTLILCLTYGQTNDSPLFGNKPLKCCWNLFQRHTLMSHNAAIVVSQKQVINKDYSLPTLFQKL